MLEISSAKRRELRAQAHHLTPVVSIAANGLSESVTKEIDVALAAHELIKIRVYGDDREVRNTIMESLCKTLGCAAIQHIGKLLIVYRYNSALHKPIISPKSLRKSSLPMALRAKEPRRPGSRSTVGTSSARRLTLAKKAPTRPKTFKSSLPKKARDD